MILYYYIKAKWEDTYMRKYDLITPEGTRDLLFDESVARRTAEEKLRRLFENYGYSEVITPGEIGRAHV